MCLLTVANVTDITAPWWLPTACESLLVWNPTRKALKSKLQNPLNLSCCWWKMFLIFVFIFFQTHDYVLVVSLKKFLHLQINNPVYNSASSPQDSVAQRTCGDNTGTVAELWLNVSPQWEQTAETQTCTVSESDKTNNSTHTSCLHGSCCYLVKPGTVQHTAAFFTLCVCVCQLE